ncbi:MAG: transposase [Chitinophagales bacterium]|nr:MAG: transposase [Chitinophagales bacterium]
MKRERRHFDKAFKLMAVELCHTGKPPKEVADELGIRAELVRRWRREYEQYQEGSFSGQGVANMTAEQKEIARLKKALKDVQIERDILKKAVSIFSRSDGRYSNS